MYDLGLPDPSLSHSGRTGKQRPKPGISWSGGPQWTGLPLPRPKNQRCSKTHSIFRKQTLSLTAKPKAVEVSKIKVLNSGGPRQQTKYLKSGAYELKEWDTQFRVPGNGDLRTIGCPDADTAGEPHTNADIPRLRDPPPKVARLTSVHSKHWGPPAYFLKL